MPAILTGSADRPLQGQAWFGTALLEASLALLIAAPVLLNLLGACLADGDSFVIVAGGTMACLVAMLVGALSIGLPWRDLTRLHGPTLVAGIAFLVFWGLYLGTVIASPSPIAAMRAAPLYALAWIVIPGAMLFVYRRCIDPLRLIRWMIVFTTLYVIGLSALYLTGGGLYHSGRWHAGRSLEAIRTGRYCAVAIWLFVSVLLHPSLKAERVLRWTAAASIFPALLMMVVSNARGPWLALAATLLLLVPAAARRLLPRIADNILVLVPMAVTAAALALFVLAQMDDMRSDFSRLFSLTHDGGSAAHHAKLMKAHMDLVLNDPMLLLTGAGYGHGKWYPHCIPIEALSVGGLPLLALYLLFSWQPVLVALRDHLDDPTLLMPFGLFIMGSIGSMVSGTLFYEPLLWLAGIATLVVNGSVVALTQRERLPGHGTTAARTEHQRTQLLSSRRCRDTPGEATRRSLPTEHGPRIG